VATSTLSPRRNTPKLTQLDASLTCPVGPPSSVPGPFRLESTSIHIRDDKGYQTAFTYRDVHIESAESDIEMDHFEAVHCSAHLHSDPLHIRTRHPFGIPTMAGLLRRTTMDCRPVLQVRLALSEPSYAVEPSLLPLTCYRGSTLQRHSSLRFRVSRRIAVWFRRIDQSGILPSC
jgi:hypothetical protein